MTTPAQTRPSTPTLDPDPRPNPALDPGSDPVPSPERDPARNPDPDPVPKPEPRPVLDSDFCEAPTRISHEIRFTRGTTSETIEEQAKPGEVDRYRIESGTNQIMTISLITRDSAIVVTLMQPDGLVFPDSFVEKRINSTLSGDYFICVNPGQSVVDYQLRVSIVDNTIPPQFQHIDWCWEVVQERGEIKFTTGTSSGSVRQSVIRGERDLYRLDASGGQSMNVSLTSLENNAVFALQSPSGEILVAEVSEFGISLPESGTYQFCIGGTRGNATYTLTAEID